MIPRAALVVVCLVLSCAVPGCAVPEDRVQLEPLYRSVAALCETEACSSDYSVGGCKFYLFQDALYPVFFAAAEQECLAAITAQVDCLAAAGMCSDERCPFPEAECTPAETPPSWRPPASVADVIYYGLAHQEECGELYEPIDVERRQYIAEMTALLLAARYESGEACSDAYAELLRCENSFACDADVEALCAGATVRLRAACS